MKITLKPLSHPEFEEIVMHDDLFSVGCNEPPFSALPNAAGLGLSPSHAKLIRQQDALYVVDLGSRGGTTVNGQSVHKRALPIQNGDEVCFAGQICFAVGTAEQQWPDRGYEPLALILVPTREDVPLEPIVVEHFPFLIGKDVGVFSGYKTRFPEQCRYISRRHALIFRQQGDLYVEDLGSTNGTFLGGQRVEAGARLEDRANIAFGGEFFSYRMELDRVVPAEITQAPGTIFVTAADSFLDAFCPEADADLGAAADSGGAKAQVQPHPSAGKPRRTGPFGRLRIFLAELRTAFADDDPDRPKRRWAWLLLAGGLLTVAFALGLYLKSGPERAIRELMAAGRYADSAAMANRYLEAHPDSERIGLLGAESLAKHVVPVWMTQMEKGDFDAAERVLAPAGQLSQFNDDGLKMLALIEWAGRLERFVTKRGGPQAPIVIFQDEETIAKLVEWWGNDSPGHRNRLTRLMDYVPEFRPVGVHVTSHLVGLQNQKSVYLQAIAQLAQSIRKRLAAGHSSDLADVLRAFQSRYPRIRGMDRVRLDLERWNAIFAAIRGKDLDAALRLSRRGEFSTPLFRKAARVHILAQLPPPAIAEEYEKAENAWSDGNWDHAFALLQGLASRPWGEVAKQRLQHYRSVLNDYLSLRQARGSAGYGQRLLAFYNRLDPAADAHLRRAIEADFQSYRAQALVEVKSELQRAARDWKRYQADGGIDGLLRLEDVVSATFKRQAGLLSHAFEQASVMISTYALLQQESPPAAKRLYEDLFAEIKRQRQWLEDMSIVLSASLLEAKLALLPGPLGTINNER